LEANSAWLSRRFTGRFQYNSRPATIAMKREASSRQKPTDSAAGFSH
jgi:hypothetical protein